MHATMIYITYSLKVIMPMAQMSHFSLYSLFSVISGAANENVSTIGNSKQTIAKTASKS